MADREVNVKRNLIEQALMNMRYIVYEHRSMVLKAVMIIVVLMVLVISGLVYADYKVNKDTAAFEAVLEEYRTVYTVIETERKEKLDRTAAKLKSIVEDSYFGYVHRYGYYIIAGLYFHERDFSNAAVYYEKASHYASPLFASIALQQAGVASENLNNVDEALRFYLLCETEYSDAHNIAQVIFSIGRMYAQKGEHFKAREYFTKVTAEFPQSAFSQKAAQYNMFLGAFEHQKKN